MIYNKNNLDQIENGRNLEEGNFATRISPAFDSVRFLVDLKCSLSILGFFFNLNRRSLDTFHKQRN